MVKRCSKCGQNKPLDQFFNSRSTPSGKTYHCKACMSVKTRAWREAHKEQTKETSRIWRRGKHRRIRLWNAYKMSVEEYELLLEAQGGVCAICGRPETAVNQWGPLVLAVDHDHITGVIRGLLCHRCNRGLGYFHDNPEYLIEAAHYVERTTTGHMPATRGTTV